MGYFTEEEKARINKHRCPKLKEMDIKEIRSLAVKLAKSSTDPVFMMAVCLEIELRHLAKMPTAYTKADLLETLEEVEKVQERALWSPEFYLPTLCNSPKIREVRKQVKDRERNKQTRSRSKHAKTTAISRKTRYPL